MRNMRGQLRWIVVALRNGFVCPPPLVARLFVVNGRWLSQPGHWLSSRVGALVRKGREKEEKRRKKLTRLRFKPWMVEACGEGFW